jgi:hypothetical protein
MQRIFDFLVENDKLATALIAIAALIVSVSAIVVAVANLWIQRTHNRKSVLPVGHITVGDYENEIVVHFCNDGIGPLLVEKVTVTQAGVESDSQTSLIDFMPGLPGDYAWTTFVRDIVGRAISPRDRITLISLQGDPEQEDFAASKVIVRKILSTLAVKIEYKNVYDDTMPVAERHLDWFGRSL